MTVDRISGRAAEGGTEVGGSGVSGMRFVAIVVALAAVTGSLRAQIGFDAREAELTRTGEGSGDWLGARARTLGDVNRDGVMDLIVTARFHDGNGTDSGRVYVYSGLTRSLLYVFDGEAALDELGHHLCTPGDVTGDDCADIVLAAYEYDEVGKTDAGRVYVYSGKTGLLKHVWTGEAPFDNFGYTVESAGDTDGDELNNILIGTFRHDSRGANTGRAYLYSGVTGQLLWRWDGEAAGDQFAYRLDTAGDVDDDGRDDVIISSIGNDESGRNAGKVYVYSGRTGQTIHELRGEDADDQFGERVGPAGDLNGDGHDDFFVASLTHDSNGPGSGRVYVYSGASGQPLYILDGERAWDGFGDRIHGLSDIDRDGRPDLVIGTPFGDDGAKNDAGSVCVFSGRTGRLLFRVYGEEADDRLGRSIFFPGDVNGDEYNDVIAGAITNDGGGTDAGRVYVYSGRTGRMLYRVTGEHPMDQFGYSVAPAGDLNNDGLPDLAIGSPYNDAGGVEGGRAYFFLSHGLYLAKTDLVRGAVNRIAMTGAVPGERVNLVGSPGGRLSLSEPRLLGYRQDRNPKTLMAASAVADQYGEAVFELYIPQNMGGALVYLQATSRRQVGGQIRVMTSNLVAATVD